VLLPSLNARRSLADPRRSHRLGTPERHLSPVGPDSRLHRAGPKRPGVVLVMLVAIVITAAAVVFTVSRFVPFSSGPAAGSASPPTRPGSYLGVYESGALNSYRPVADFTKAAGRQPNLVGYYSGWGEPFQTSFAETAREHGAATILQWDPTDASVSSIAAGHYDSYLRAFADSVRNFGHPVIMGFGHEMNANWYSWGYGHLAPSTFVAAWRHIVTLFRDQGANNVTWLWTLQADEPGTGTIAAWWPGAQYVTWVGIDGYYYRPFETFSSVFGATIAQVRMFTHLPVLLSEAAVGPEAGQTAKIPNLFAGMRQYGLLGLVWFDVTQNQGIYHQDWHIEDSPAAEKAFRSEASTLPLWNP
jgi:Glycosyl hydrolase family 26